MSKAIRYIIFLVLLQTVTSLFPLFAQQPVSVSGIVKDSVTGEALPFVSVYFDGSTIGAMTDDNGAFSLQNNQGYYKLSAVSVNKGDKVKTGQQLGTIYTDKENGNATILHFQLRNEKAKLNPELWLDK